MTRVMQHGSLLRALGVLMLIALPDPARAAPEPGWRDAKCTRYRDAWTALLARPAGLGAAFREANERFLRSGCQEGGTVCPRSAAEIEAADTLTVLMMNFGTASTFLPFGCRPAGGVADPKTPPLTPSP